MAKYMRSNSVRPDPHEKLLECVKRNNLREISNLLSSNRILLTEEYSNGLSILEMTCYQLADEVQANTIRELLKFGADPTRSYPTWDSKSCIHFATMGQNPDILEVIATDPKVEINATTQGRNALHILIIDGEPSKNFEACVRTLCCHGIDTQWRDLKGNRAIYFAARKKYTNIVKILLAQNNRVTTKEAGLLDALNADLVYVIDDSESTLTGVDYLTRKDETSFVSWYDQQKDDIDNKEKSYLQLACERNLQTVAKFLIEKDPNKVGSVNKVHPLLIAVQHGYYQLVNLFLDASTLEVPPNLINEALKRADLDGNGRTIDYERSSKTILNRGGIDVNERDSINGCYPLHYAVKYGGKVIISELLKQKASLANRDRYNYLTVQDIDHDTLQQHFDSCIEAHPADPKDDSRESMYFSFDFSTLFPTRDPPKEDSVPDCENNFLHKKQFCAVKETDAILNMTKDIEQKPLLLHPLIVTFLYVKWHRVRFLFLTNLIIYLLFCASLLWFICSNYNEPNKVSVDLSFVSLLITTILISLREAFQIAFLFCKYFKSTDNYVELALLIDIYALLFTTSTDHQRRPMFAIAVLLTALELLFLFGSAPGMSTYIVMLRTVSFNFVKFLLFNAILILAFAFSFYTLFRKNPEEKSDGTIPSQPPPSDENEDDGFFKSIYLAVFKTLIMLTGEFEAGDLDFNQYPMVSHLIFIFFVFLIAVILLNLLNGLAVSDTQEIKNEAKLIALVTRAKYVAHVEALVFDNVLSGSCAPGFNFISASMKQAWQRWMLNRICIAQNLSDGCLKVYPNLERRIVWNAPVSSSCTWLFGGDKLHEGTVKMAKTIVSNRHTTDSREDTKCEELYNMMIEIKLALSNADLI